MTIKVSVPATSANLGPGFDIWAVALNVRNDFLAKPAKQTSVQFRAEGYAAGGQLPKLSSGADNLLVKCYNHVFEKAGLEPIPADIECVLRIPVERGLGSSSTAILGGMFLGNEMMREHKAKAYSPEMLFRFALEYESHPDNLAAALYGGWALCLHSETDGQAETINLPFRAPVKIAGIIPELTLETTRAREVVSESLNLNEISFQLSRTALLVHLLEKPDWGETEKKLMQKALQDRIHQNQRAKLIPGMLETFADWAKNGAYGSYLSGAGSTLLAFWPPEHDTSGAEMGKVLKDKGLKYQVFSAAVDHEGTTVEKLP